MSIISDLMQCDFTVTFPDQTTVRDRAHRTLTHVVAGKVRGRWEIQDYQGSASAAQVSLRRLSSWSSTADPDRPTDLCVLPLVPAKN